MIYTYADFFYAQHNSELKCMLEMDGREFFFAHESKSANRKSIHAGKFEEKEVGFFIIWFSGGMGS